MRACLFNAPLEECLANRVDTIIKVLTKLNYEIEIAQDIKPIVVHADERIYNKYHLFFPFRLSKGLFSAKYLIKKRFDLIISFSDPFRAAIPLILAKTVSVPIIFDLWFDYTESQIQEGFWRAGGFSHILAYTFQYNSLKYADAVLLGGDIKQDILRAYKSLDPSKLFVLPNLIDFRVYDPKKYNKIETKKKYGLDEDSFIIMYHGTFLGIHGLEYVVKAIPIVVSSQPKAKFLFIGPYNLGYKRIRDLAKKLKVLDKIIFAGQIDKENIPKFLTIADISLGLFSANPKAQRAIRYSSIEAMAMGLPILTSESPGVKNIIINYENGLKVPPEDHKSIAEAILYLLDSPIQREKMGINARKYVLRHNNINSAEKIIKAAIKKAVHS